MEYFERTCVMVNLDAIHSNMEHMKANIRKETRMIAVIKTDGYGHGAVPIARELEALPYLYGFATATVEEAEELRKAGIIKPILILGYTFPGCYDTLAELEIRPAVFRRDMAELLNRAAEKNGRPMKIHIKVDTGMGRIGIRPDEQGLSFIKDVLAMDYLEVEGIFTHFARADEADKSAAELQRKRFVDFTRQIEQETGYRIPICHCSNSAGLLEMEEANLDVVRAGITLYGLWPSAEVRRDIVSLQSALSWNSHIVYCKEIKAGDAVSYGGTYVAEENVRVATVPVGYGDGYPRSLSNKGYVLIHGKRAPILGRVCMDQMMVDVTDIPEAAEGSEVTLIGVNGTERITAEELGELSGRFNYELVCCIGKRVPRIYQKAGKLYNRDGFLL
ncbi:MAG: alanine racemase [Lachnospiraceae bacterium]|nr:alanine racemase [Lachnospiraceae bacterium]